jgi:hypothetical protein
MEVSKEMMRAVESWVGKAEVSSLDDQQIINRFVQFHSMHDALIWLDDHIEELSPSLRALFDEAMSAHRRTYNSDGN